MTAPEVAHRRALAGVGLCGARESEGAKIVPHLRFVTCKLCWLKTEEMRLRGRKVR